MRVFDNRKKYEGERRRKKKKERKGVVESDNRITIQDKEGKNAGQ